EVRAFDAPLGAEIIGLDLNDPLGPETVETINQAFFDHHVLAIRDQDISMDRFMDVAGCFGTLQSQHVKHYAHPNTDKVSMISPQLNDDRSGPNAKPLYRGITFHTDHSYFPVPCKATLLHAKQTPSKGGDTRFLNMHTVYDDLTEEMKNKVDGLNCLHRLAGSRRNKTGRVMSDEEIQNSPTAVHPLVWVHEDTGRKAIYFNPNRMDGIEGWSDEDSDALLDELEALSFQARYEYRHKWKPHDVVIWDNRSVLHAATDDYDEPRLLHRILLEGTKPS
ncbi:MAG: TauD/TfdA dioxygenase family protein, partial [Rhodospirillales bacterium]